MKLMFDTNIRESDLTAIDLVRDLERYGVQQEKRFRKHQLMNLFDRLCISWMLLGFASQAFDVIWLGHDLFLNNVYQPGMVNYNGETGFLITTLFWYLYNLKVLWACFIAGHIIVLSFTCYYRSSQIANQSENSKFKKPVNALLFILLCDVCCVRFISSVRMLTHGDRSNYLVF